MRIDKQTGREYNDFWDWLQDDGHLIWALTLVFAYAAYLLSTEEA